MSVSVIKPHNKVEIKPDVMSKFLRTGDVIHFNDEEKLQIMHMICKRLGVDPISRPLELLKLPGTDKMPAREIWYLSATGCELIAGIWKMSFRIKEKGIEKDEGVAYYVIEGKIPDTDRVDEATAYVECGTRLTNGEVKLWFGTQMANARMKAETKARRRLIRRLTGLDFIDEDDIRDDKKDSDMKKKADELAAAMTGQENNDTPKLELVTTEPEELEVYDRSTTSHKVILKDVCVKAGLSLKEDIAFIKQLQDELIEEKITININDPSAFSEVVTKKIEAKKASNESILDGSEDL